MLIVIASTLSSNSALYSGAGIYNAGNESGRATVTISNTTFSGNSVDYYGGAIYNYAGDGTATVAIVNSTLNRNSAGFSAGGIYNDGFSGGLATLDIGSTILNAGASGENITNDTGTIISRGYNLSSDGGAGSLTNTADQINTHPQLGPLQNNGGPTLTHAPLPGSPAIDRGKSFGSTTDQRGLPRPVDDGCLANASG